MGPSRFSYAEMYCTGSDRSVAAGCALCPRGYSGRELISQMYLTVQNTTSLTSRAGCGAAPRRLLRRVGTVIVPLPPTQREPRVLRAHLPLTNRRRQGNVPAPSLDAHLPAPPAPRPPPRPPDNNR